MKAEPEENDQPQLATGTDAVVKTETEDEKRPVSLPQEGRLRKENIGTVVHITDMSWYTTDIEVEAACGAFGTVKNVKFFEDRSNGRSMGSCAVEFASIDEAKACIAGLNSSRVGQDDQVAVDWPGKRPPFKNRCFQIAFVRGRAWCQMGCSALQMPQPLLANSRPPVPEQTLLNV